MERYPYKIISLLLLLLLLSTKAFSKISFVSHLVKNPLYISVLAGYSAVNYNNSLLRGGAQASSIKDSGLAPKVALGIDFTRFFGFEIGIIYFQKPTFYGLHGSPFIIKNNVFYFAGKLMWPIDHIFTIYAKGGYGWVARDGINMGSIVALRAGNFDDFVYGFGATCAITSHWLLDATWMQALARHNSQLPASNYLGAGINYHFSW